MNNSRSHSLETRATIIFIPYMYKLVMSEKKVIITSMQSKLETNFFETI